ncbi:hypothetical protein LTR70_010067 [Exophiala xenobiotica]|nr:hypothetical protein LTR70_010067 [Exophiala xenobiotica]
MAASIKPSVIMTQLNSFISNNASDADALFEKQQSVITTIGSYKWLIVGWQIFHYFFIHDAPPKGLKRMPGPLSTLPWLGRVHDIPPDGPWFAWRKILEKPEYGGIAASTICGEMHVWIGKADLAKEFLIKKAKIYSSRPEVPAVPGSNSQFQYLPLMQRDEHWNQQRKFAHTVLSAAYNKQYYGFVSHEVKRFVYKLLQDPTDHFALTDRYCGRVAARMGYGSPASAAAHCKNAGEFIPQISPSGPITNLLPLLGKIPEFMNPSIRAVRQRREKEEKLWKGLLDQVKREMAMGTAAPVSYARTYFERKTIEGQPWNFDDHEAAYAIGMLVTVAIFTIGGPLYAFLLTMVLHPEWQEKVREEITRVVGTDRVIEVTDSPNLVLLRAVIRETLRWRPPVPLGVPRLLEEDDEWNGYFIPKGAIIHACDLALARDPEVYPDPENFRPERWMDKEWPTYKEPLTEHPRLMGSHHFGMGRRMCPGIELTEAELLVACGTIVNSFKLQPIKDAAGNEVPPPSYDFTANLIGGPLPFQMDCVVRPGMTEKIEKWYSDSVAVEEAGAQIFVD